MYVVNVEAETVEAEKVHGEVGFSGKGCVLIKTRMRPGFEKRSESQNLKGPPYIQVGDLTLWLSSSGSFANGDIGCRFFQNQQFAFHRRFMARLLA